MIDIQENIQLKDYTTLRIGGPAKFFVVVKSEDELQEALGYARDNALKVFMLGGGSNILVSDKGFDGLVIKLDIKGEEIIEETEDEVVVRIAGGEVLNDATGWIVENGWWGVENLSYVPGDVAGLAVQNVNCYGHDASNAIESVTAINIATGEKSEIMNADCAFGYRRSRFNAEDHGKFVITAVTLRLKKHADPVIEYPDVKKWFEGRDYSTLTLKEIREAITEIRKRKGQNPDEIWSAGSFFKNLLLTEDEFNELHQRVKDGYGDELAEQLLELKNKFSRVEKLYAGETGVKSESVASPKIKIPIGWILDHVLDLKGKLSVGGAAVSPVQVINLINTGNATAQDMMDLYNKICSIAEEKLGITITHEPEFVGFE